MKRRIIRRRRTSVGAAPGEIARPERFVRPAAREMTWNQSELEERELPEYECARLDDVPGRVRWIDVQGLGDGSLVKAVGEKYGLHPLAVADVVNVGQRPKAEQYDGVWFFVLRMMHLEEDGQIRIEQVAMFLLDGLLLTFQELPGDCLDPLRERVRRGGKRLRGGDASYLAVMVIDAIVDGYFPVLERFGELLEELEEEVVANPTSAVLTRIYRIKRELLTVRRSVWPLRETLSRLLRAEELPDAVQPYLRDALDHLSQVADIVETYREISGSFVDVYLSSVSQRTNETMRVLTVIATIFIPLTFVAGVYGMNFDTDRPGNLPELSLPYGYVLFWMVCVLLGGSLLVVFRRLGWLGGGGEE